MNRRNVLIGLGTAAVGTGAAFGSGAFTQVEAERSVNVEVAGDSSAYVGLVDNADVAAATNTTSGELEIQLDGSLHTDADGANRNASIRVSNESTVGGINDTIGSELDNAFNIVNNSDNGVDLYLDVNSGSTNELNVYWYDGTNSGTVTDSSGSTESTGSTIVTGLGSGSTVAVAIMVETDGSDTIDNTPQIRVTATDAS